LATIIKPSVNPAVRNVPIAINKLITSPLAQLEKHIVIILGV
jgi:hypothetical protein